MGLLELFAVIFHFVLHLFESLIPRELIDLSDFGFRSDSCLDGGNEEIGV